MNSRYLTNFRYAFRVRKPALIFRLVKTFLGILLLGRRPLRYVDLAIGYGCNLRCEHCFATALQRKGRRRITPAEYRSVVEQAMALGAVNFSFQGGEPTLYPELSEFIRNSYPERNVISVTTNGTTLDADSIRDLKRLGVDILTISLDSAVPEEHDAFRGVPGTFAKTTRTIEEARRQGMNVTLGAVVSHGNVRSEGLRDLIRLAHRYNVIIFLALATPVGEWGGRSDILITPEDRAHIESLRKEFPLLRTDFEGNFVHRGCGAVKEILYVTPYGDVLPCPFIHASLGNVFDESLDRIRTRALAIPYFDHYHHLCLPAEDSEFMSRNTGSFYTEDGALRRIQ